MKKDNRYNRSDGRRYSTLEFQGNAYHVQRYRQQPDAQGQDAGMRFARNQVTGEQSHVVLAPVQTGVDKTALGEAQRKAKFYEIMYGRENMGYF